MKTDVYRNFITVAECGKIGEAAEKICITQPALSKQIQSLESTYDAVLFQRAPKGLTLTAAGKILYSRAKVLCMIEDEAKYEIKYASKESSAINIGISSEIASKYWIRILAKLRDSNPYVRFNVHEGDTDAILIMLQESVLDVGIINKQPPSSFRVIDATVEKPVLASSSDSPWLADDASTFHIADLQDVPLCVTMRHLDRLIEACRDEGFFPNVMFASTSLRAIMEWALEEKAVAVMHLPDKTDCEFNDVRCASLDCPSLESQTLVVTQKNQMVPPHVQQVVNILCQISQREHPVEKVVEQF